VPCAHHKTVSELGQLGTAELIQAVDRRRVAADAIQDYPDIAEFRSRRFRSRYPFTCSATLPIGFSPKGELLESAANVIFGIRSNLGHSETPFF
jgi:hypothetical protein